MAVTRLASTKSKPLSAQGETCESMPGADGHDTMCIGDISRELEKAVNHGQASQTSEGSQGETEWMSSSERPSGGRSWTDPCVFSNAFILWVSWFLATLNNYELSLLAFLLFCASMGYHLSGETNMRYMYIDITLGRICFVYYIASTAIWADWADMQTAGMVLMGYAAFGVIICLTNGPWALKAHTDRYTRLHPLVHVLGIVPPMVGGLVCKPFIM